MSERAPLLAVHDLEVTYPERASRFRLHVPALELRAREALAVLGPNGSGKTTLLRAMAGLLPVRAGQVARPGRAEPRRVSAKPPTGAHRLGV